MSMARFLKWSMQLQIVVIFHLVIHEAITGDLWMGTTMLTLL